MGSSASKSARVAGSAARQYPTRSPPNTTIRPPVTSSPQAANTAANPAAPGPRVHPPVQATETRTEAIEQDAKDPAFASRLSSLGVVQPNPHYSPTSTSEFDPRRNSSPSLPSDMMQEPPTSAFPDPRNNPVLRVLEARQRITDEADDELRDVGRRGFAGRKYVDAGLIQLALMRQARGEPDSRIEEALGIKKGRLGVLGRRTLGAIHTE
ncbi:Nn.00g036750.m01.CDS01 [Neocucurbitaria sp. VM-36]